MVALQAAMAIPAPADMHLELAIQWPAGNLGLKLLGDALVFDGAAAMRANVGQRGVEGFVEALRSGRQAMGFEAVLVAALAARALGILDWRALGEGCGLALTGADGLFELLGEPFELGLEFRDAALQRLATRTGWRFHAANVEKRGPRSCAVRPKNANGAAARAKQLQLFT
jgi:hypothetical protein